MNKKLSMAMDGTGGDAMEGACDVCAGLTIGDSLVSAGFDILVGIYSIMNSQN